MKKSLLFLFFITFGVQAQNFWTEVAPFTSDPAYVPRQISIVDANIVWVLGQESISSSSRWSRSIDGGITWTQGDITLPNPELVVGAIHAVSETTSYVSVYPTSPAFAGGIWITQDGGMTWTQQTSAFAANSFPNFIHFWDSNTGIAVGDPQGIPPSASFEIFTTVDSGMTWMQVPMANIPPTLSGEYGYIGIYEARDNTFWFGTNTGRIFRSADQGTNWTVSQTPISDFGSSFDSGKFAFRNNNEGLLLRQNHELFRTNDAGTTWTLQIPDGVLRNFNVVFVPETNNAYFNWGNDDMEISRGSSYSTNGGMDWIDLNDADAQPVEPIEVEFHSGTVGYCIGRYLPGSGSSSDTKFFRLTDPLNRLLTNNKFDVIESFSLYPNPATDAVKIAGGNIDQVKIYDISGKEVFSNDYDSLYEVSIDMSLFQKGMYLAKVNADAGTSSTVKIVKN